MKDEGGNDEVKDRVNDSTRIATLLSFILALNAPRATSAGSAPDPLQRPSLPVFFGQLKPDRNSS
jgi:hypothetical protein